MWSFCIERGWLAPPQMLGVFYLNIKDPYTISYAADQLTDAHSVLYKWVS